MNRRRWTELTEGADPDLKQRFLEYHRENPALYSKFKEYAFEAKRSGRSRFSIWMIANRVRWYTQIETTGAEFKVSNDYLALYARLLACDYPVFENFFSFKRMKSKRVKARE